MNKRTLPALLAGLCLLALATGTAQAQAPGVHISKIQVQTGALSTSLVLETDGPLAVAQSARRALRSAAGNATVSVSQRSNSAAMAVERGSP